MNSRGIKVHGDPFRSVIQDVHGEADYGCYLLGCDVMQSYRYLIGF
jgi:hypothetical protein